MNCFVKHIVLKIVFLALLWGTSAQEYEAYSNDILKLYSKNLQDSINVNLHKPETLDLSNPDVTYPVTVIFDSQHQMTYPRIINSFDFLTIEALIPETIIIGIPFNIKNRGYLTSDEVKKDDDTMGIDRMERFVFDELLPILKANYKANDFTMLVGHSRSAFLVNYLFFKNSDRVNIVASLSGFYKEHPLDDGVFENFLSRNSKFPQPTQLFLTVGTSEEESNYKKQYDALDAYLKEQGLSNNLKFSYKLNPEATHMVNYWMSVPQILLSCYTAYGKIVSDWLYYKLEDQTIREPFEAYIADLEQIQKKLNLKANPSLTHLISFANFYSNSKQNEIAIEFLELGLEYYPEYFDFYPFIIELYTELGDDKNKDKYIDIYKTKVNNSKRLSTTEKKTRLSPY